MPANWRLCSGADLAQELAELDAAEAGVRIEELMLTEELDTKRIDDWKKKQEKAEAAASKLARLIAELP